MNKKLRVWYVGRMLSDKSTYIDVKNIEEAKLVINAFIERDLNDDRITDNAMGLQVFENNEWSEYYNSKGDDIDELMK